VTRFRVDEVKVRGDYLKEEGIGVGSQLLEDLFLDGGVGEPVL
jgi:hypothetical protein